jgi:predicted ATP-grasp superfamily ATP-dependent carboligase
MGFPVVVKPHRSVVRSTNGRPRRKFPVTIADNEEECRARLAALPAEAYPVLLQQRIRGPGEGIFLLRWDGKIVARFGHRRLREKPPAGGVSVYRESVVVEPEFAAAAERLLDSLDWRGVAMVECKRDITTGRLVLMEINGRLWGSLQLALDAGVDFPVLLAECALGEELPDRPPVYRVGARTRWLWGDIDHLLTRMRHSRAALHLPPEAPSRWGVIREFFRWRPGQDRWEVERPGDPAPFILETLRRLRPER